jgi:hypothetical protein
MVPPGSKHKYLDSRAHAVGTFVLKDTNLTGRQLNEMGHCLLSKKIQRAFFFFFTYKSHQFANFKISSTQEVEISKYQAVLNQKEIRKKTEQNE